LGMPGVTRADIVSLDSDGLAVYDLVMEVTIRKTDGVEEPKPQYLKRIMETGSRRAKILKLADRLSNLFALGFVHDASFVRRYLEETRTCILPYAEQINQDMYRELTDLLADRDKKLAERLPLE